MRGFSEIPDYYLINGGAHLKPAAQVAAPALTCHLAFWDSSTTTADNSTAVPQTPLRSWLRQIDSFLAAFARASYLRWQHDLRAGTATLEMRPYVISDQPPDARSTRLLWHCVDDLFSSGDSLPEIQALEGTEINQYAQETFSLKFPYRGIPMKLRVLRHSEFLTLTLFAELRPPVTIPSDPVRVRLVECFATLAAELPARFARLEAHRTDTPRESELPGKRAMETITALSDAPAYLYSTFWRNFWSEFEELLDGVDVKDLGLLFGDFRGLILSGRKPQEKNHQKATWEIDEPFASRKRADDSPPLSNLNSAQVVALTDTLRLVLQAAESPYSNKERLRENPTTRLPGIEYSASQLSKGRVLHIASLTANRSWRISQEELHQPLRYLVYAPRRNRWQMARLIERLHVAESYRLASLMGLSQLNVANDALKALAVGADEPAAVTHIDELHRRLAEIESACSGGLAYRIERATRYVTGFRALAGQLRIRRIEGYQPYDEFVQRRIGSFWSFIERLGDRLDRARKLLNSINVKLQTLEQQKQTEEQAKQTEGQTRQTQEQTKLLRVAEVIAAVPIGYYGAQFLHSLAIMAHHREFVMGPLVLTDEATHWLYASLVMLLYAVSLPLLRVTPGRLPRASSSAPPAR